MTVSAFGVDHADAIAKRDFSAGQRKKLTAKGDAIDGKLPIKDAHDLTNAERLAGKVKGIPPKRVHAYLDKEKKKFGEPVDKALRLPGSGRRQVKKLTKIAGQLEAKRNQLAGENQDLRFEHQGLRRQVDEQGGGVSKAWSDRARDAALQARQHGQRAVAYSQQTGPFDSEKQRHRRSDVQAGAAAGGSVVAAGSARRQALAAGAARKDAKTLRARSDAGHASVQDNLHRMGQPTATAGALSSRAENATRTARMHREATGVGEAAQKASRAARVAGRRSRAGAAASAGLGVAAYAVHRHDDKPGRSYGYR